MCGIENLISFLLFIYRPSVDSFLLHFSGWFARNPSVLHNVGHVLLQLSAAEPRRSRRLVYADDLFQLLKVPKQKTVHVISKAIESLSGCKLKFSVC